MKSLNQQQIKQQELQLLETDGFSLAQCSTTLNSNKVIKEPTHSLKVTEIQRLKVTRVRTLGLSANANLRAFGLALLTSIYSSSQLKEDLLDTIKSFLYHPALDLTQIRHSPLSEVSSKQMKKLVVQFFYSLAYSNYDDKIEGKLCKYPIIMDILVIFLRSILAHSSIKHADDYLLKLQTKESFETLIDFFDLNCKARNSMFLFYEDRLFLYQNQQGEVLIGNYCENQIQKPHHEGGRGKLPYLAEQIDEETENQRSERPSLTSHNRSLELSGIVSESIVFQPEAQTPFFNFQHKSNSLFQSSQETRQQEEESQKHLTKSAKQSNLLKSIDMSIHQYQTNTAFGSLKRTFLQNQLKESLEEKQALAMDSPITLDSPHTLTLQGNFTKQRDRRFEQQIQVMKKSKSQSSRSVNNPTANNQQQVSNQVTMKKTQKRQKFFIAKPTSTEKKNCQCAAAKKKAIKIHSNLYEINMRFVLSSKPTIRKTKPPLQGEYYTNSKGLNCELYQPNLQITSMQHIRQNFLKEKHKPNLNSSINSCFFLPQAQKSETQSKREFSPLSNFGDRSFSPFGGTSSITSPKITFTYKNPLKYSIQIPKNKSENKR